jgi:hypothetical protein
MLLSGYHLRSRSRLQQAPEWVRSSDSSAEVFISRTSVRRPSLGHCALQGDVGIDSGFLHAFQCGYCLQSIR